MRRTFVSILLVLTVVAAACSDDDPLAGRSGWDKGALTTLDALRAKVATALPGQCTKLDANDFAAFKNTVKTLDLKTVPLAQALCDLADDETIEFSQFKDSGARDRSLAERTKKLCRIALHPKGGRQPVDGFPGLRFVVGDAWSVQIDSQGRGRELAATLGGRYVGMPCEKDVSDWDAAALDRISELLGRVDKQDCPAVVVDDHEAVRLQQYFRRTLPDASVTCAPESSKIHLFSYGSAVTDHASYLHGVTDYYCVEGYSTVGISGDTWGAVTIDKDPAFVTKIAKTLGGTVDPFVCKAKPLRGGAVGSTTTPAP